MSAASPETRRGQVRTGLVAAALVSVALHAGLLVPWTSSKERNTSAPTPSSASPVSLLTELPKKQVPVVKSASQPQRAQPPQTTYSGPPLATSDLTPASVAAPPAPTAEEWAIASTYTLKNSKRYRYNWGQQVRSMMGTAVEGPQQGHVRFRIEIASDGKLAKIETLWSTSEVAERLARHAMESLPPLPPTPTGAPLVFEQTIAFVPYESGWPPIYKYDCFADAPTFKNPFVWNGTSPQVDPPIVPRSAPPPTKAPNHVGCHNDAQPDSMEAETADIKRQFDFWGVRLWNGVK